MSNPSQGASFNDQDFALNQIAPNVPKINSNSKKIIEQKRFGSISGSRIGFGGS